jgi:hypothetical protein
MDSTPQPAARDSLPRELTEFLIEFSIALQKFAIYPAGHPMLAKTVERLERRLILLLDTREALSLGVANTQLVIEGIATDEHNAVLRDLAQRLHRHHLGALKIGRGVQTDELREMLFVVGMELTKDAIPVGLRPPSEIPEWSHVHLYPLAYEHLELLDDDSSALKPMAGERIRGGGARAARLWVGLAQAALVGRDALTGPRRPPGPRAAQQKASPAQAPGPLAQPGGPAPNAPAEVSVVPAVPEPVTPPKRPRHPDAMAFTMDEVTGAARAEPAPVQAPVPPAPPVAEQVASTTTGAAESPTDAAADAAMERAAADAAADPLAVARAIDEHHREAAYDQVIVGYMLQIADELKEAKGDDAAVLRTRVSKMVGAMRPDTLKTLLSMGNDAAQRRQFVLDAAQGMAVEAVVELVRAAADASNQSISHSMLRLLSKLAVHASEDTGTRRAGADAALRDNVRTLVAQWTLEDPNPGAYRDVLEGMAKSKPSAVTVQSATYPVEEERLLQIALEIGVSGESTWRALEGMVGRRRLSAVVALLDRAPRPHVAEQAWERLATTKRLREFLDHADPDWHPLERIVSRLGLGAAEVLLDQLDSGVESRRQSHIITLLTKLGDDVGAAAARRLPQATPDIQALLLGLIGRLKTLPSGFSADDWTRHRAPTVRREAIKLLLKEPSRREHGITLGLMDSDDRAVLLALNEASTSCPPSALPIIMNRVDRDDIPAPLRALAIRTVAGVQSPDVVEWVLRFVMIGRKRFFGGERLAPKSPELLAALAALGTHWRTDPRAAEMLARALKHTDAEIRKAAQASPRSLATGKPE